MKMTRKAAGRTEHPRDFEWQPEVLDGVLQTAGSQHRCRKISPVLPSCPRRPGVGQACGCQTLGSAMAIATHVVALQDQAQGPGQRLPVRSMCRQGSFWLHRHVTTRPEAAGSKQLPGVRQVTEVSHAVCWCSVCYRGNPDYFPVGSSSQAGLHPGDQELTLARARHAPLAQIHHALSTQFPPSLTHLTPFCGQP